MFKGYTGTPDQVLGALRAQSRAACTVVCSAASDTQLVARVPAKHTHPYCLQCVRSGFCMCVVSPTLCVIGHCIAMERLAQEAAALR